MAYFILYELLSRSLPTRTSMIPRMPYPKSQIPGSDKHRECRTLCSRQTQSRLTAREVLQAQCPPVHCTNLTDWKSGGIYLAHESSGLKGWIKEVQVHCSLPWLRLEKTELL